MPREWKVRVVGLVTRMDGERRVSVQRGDYKMAEVGSDSYELTAEGFPSFTLTDVEVGTYVNASDLRVIEGDWP